jgi:hypothetical protein
VAAAPYFAGLRMAFSSKRNGTLDLEAIEGSLSGQSGDNGTRLSRFDSVYDI